MILALLSKGGFMKTENIFKKMLSNWKTDGTDNFINFYDKLFDISNGVSYKNTKISLEELALDSHVFTTDDLIGLESCLDEIILKLKALKKTIQYKQVFADKEVEFLKEKLNEKIVYHSIIDNLLENSFNYSSFSQYVPYIFTNIYDVLDGESFFQLCRGDSYDFSDFTTFVNENTLRLSFTKRFVENVLLFPDELNHDTFDVFLETYDGFVNILPQENLSLLKSINVQKYCYGLIIKGSGVSNFTSRNAKVTCRDFAKNDSVIYNGFYKISFDSSITASSYKIVLPPNTLGFIVRNEVDYSSVKKEDLLYFLKGDSFSEEIISGNVYEHSFFDYYFVFFVETNLVSVKKPLFFLT